MEVERRFDWGRLDHQIKAMCVEERKPRLSRLPLAKQLMVGAGILLMIGAVLIGPLPGPGFIILFPVGLALVLRNSRWAKRLYVRLKRRKPQMGRWADWGMRRPSALRREARLKESEPSRPPLGD